MVATQNREPEQVIIGPHRLEGALLVPEDAIGLAIFAHDSGSSRFSPRNNHVARQLERSGFATLLLDLLTAEEAMDQGNLFNIEQLASRLMQATRWARRTPGLRRLPICYLGAGTSGAAVLAAAAMDPVHVRAVALHGGRPDLADEWLRALQVPTLLLVGSRDSNVLELNHVAIGRMKCTVELCLVSGAGHLFEEHGTLDYVLRKTTLWFERYLNRDEVAPVHLRSADCREAGRLTAP